MMTTVAASLYPRGSVQYGIGVLGVIIMEKLPQVAPSPRIYITVLLRTLKVLNLMEWTLEMNYSSSENLFSLST